MSRNVRAHLFLVRVGRGSARLLGRRLHLDWLALLRAVHGCLSVSGCCPVRLHTATATAPCAYHPATLRRAVTSPGAPADRPGAHRAPLAAHRRQGAQLLHRHSGHLPSRLPIRLSPSRLPSRLASRLSSHHPNGAVWKV